MTKDLTAEIGIDECIQGYIACIDQLEYYARQLAKNYKQEKHDYLDGLCEKVEGLLEDIELIKDDCHDEEET